MFVDWFSLFLGGLVLVVHDDEESIFGNRTELIEIKMNKNTPQRQQTTPPTNWSFEISIFVRA